MFDSDFWNEVLQTIKSQRGRSVMTAFGVFWGIFMLTLLVGAGMGLDNGVIGNVKSLPANLLWIVPEPTTMEYKGLGRDRSWKLNSHDEELVRQKLGDRVDFVCAVSEADYQNVTFGDRTYQYRVAGVFPQFYGSLPQRLTAGRFINDIDMAEHRKVCVIGLYAAEALFGSSEAAIGRDVVVNGMPLTVVGVSKCTNKQINIGLDISESVFMPFPTEQAAYGKADEIDFMAVILNDQSPANLYKDIITGIIKENHAVHPDDVQALWAVSLADQATMFLNAFTGISILIWVIGLGTLAGGLIGITNIMLVTVKERTQEIGIRRAIGAQPKAIVWQIMSESMLLTTVAGVAGLCLAVTLLSVVNNMLPDGDDTPFRHPFMPFWTAVVSLLILILGGLLAGWIPTRHALDIKPVDALRDE